MTSTRLRPRALARLVKPRSSLIYKAPFVPHTQQRERAAAAATTVNPFPEDEYPLKAPSSAIKSSHSRREAIRDAKPFSSFLTDNFNRQHDYLRISITEKCNLRCLYCMPEEGVPQSPPPDLLTSPEIFLLSQVFVSQGVTKIRLTGGEPTIRRDILPLMHQIGSLRSQGLKELCLTTNGISLHRKLDNMVEAGLTGVNLSLDTLDPWQFQIMTRRKGFEAVMKSISRILEMNELGAGIKLKINCVVMRGMNDNEILPFVELGREKNLEVRFIEYMPFDGNKWSKGKMLGYAEMLEMIRAKYHDVRKVQDHKNDTSKTYQIPGFVGKIGFITSMTHNFCGTCNRLRITSDGNLKVCLFGNAEVSLRDILRESNHGEPINEEAFEAMKNIESARHQGLRGFDGPLVVSESEQKLLDVIGMAVSKKKEKHAGMGELENMKNRPMILIDDLYSSNQFMPNKKLRINTTQPRFKIPTYMLPQRTQQSIRAFSTSQSSRLKGISKTIEGDEMKSSKTATTEPKLTHLTSNSTVHMVPISSKPITSRTAVAVCTVLFSNRTAISLIKENAMKKGDVLGVARVAGIMAAKRTSDLIPLCHPIGITHVEVAVDMAGEKPADGSGVSDKSVKESLQWASTGQGDAYSEKWDATRGSRERKADPSWADAPHGRIDISATVSCDGKTGVEMEALTAASVAALTVYDMCKAVDKGIRVDGLRIVRKEGGSSGRWIDGEKADDGA